MDKIIPLDPSGSVGYFLKCSECNQDVLEGEIYTDFYYCIHCTIPREISCPSSPPVSNIKLPETAT